MIRALALATLGLVLPAAAWPVTFSFQPARSGQVESVTSHFDFEGSMEVKSGGKALFTMPFSASQDERVETEVLAVAEKLPTKVRVRYPVAEEKATFGDKTEDKKPEVAGKSYLIEKRDGKVTVTREDGEAMSSKEEKELADHAKDLEDPESACDGLAGRDWKVGDQADLRDPGIASILRMTADDELEHFALTLKEIRSGRSGEGKPGKGETQWVVFDLSLRFRAKGFEGGELSLPMSGELVVEAPGCRPVSFTGSGRMEMEMKTETEEMPLEMKGSGLIRVTMRGESR